MKTDQAVSERFRPGTPCARLYKRNHRHECVNADHVRPVKDLTEVSSGDLDLDRVGQTHDYLRSGGRNRNIET